MFLLFARQAGPTSSVEKGDEGPQALHDELWKVDFDAWQQVYSTNVTGYYYMSVAYLPLLAAATKANPAHSGSIVRFAFSRSDVRLIAVRRSTSAVSAASLALLSITWLITLRRQLASS